MSSRGGRGGGRGSKRSSKGGRRHFTNPDEIQAQMDKEEKKKAWRKQQGIESESSGDEEDDDAKPKEPEPAAKSKPKKEHGAPGELPPSSSEEDSEEESSEDEPDKPKGVSHLIDIENPNRVKQGPKKVTDVTADGKADTTQLSRREREEIEKQEAHARYMKKHLAGETQEAQADLARLALIRAKREEAAAKKAAAAEAAAAAAAGDKKT